jgi:hypothetical protein
LQSRLIFLSPIQLDALIHPHPNAINREGERAHIDVDVDVSGNRGEEHELEYDAWEQPELEEPRDDAESPRLELEEESRDDIGSFVVIESWRPEVGTMFDSLDDAERQIKAWARTTGFEAKRGHTKFGTENLGTYLAFELSQE